MRERARHGGGARAGLMSGALSCALLGGCVSAFQRHRSALGAMHAEGRYEEIERALDDPGVRGLYGEKNELLWAMDRGAAALAVGDLEVTIAALSGAEERMAARRGSGALESVGSFLINDTVTTYLGEPYEEMYLNVFKMLAQLEAGRVSGGATVEARRMAMKANLLRDEYLRSAATARKAVEEEADGAAVGAASGGRYALDSGGNFIESPLGVYLSGVTFLHDGDGNGQRVAARRLQQAFEAQAGLIGPVDAGAFEGMEEWTVPAPGSGRGHLLVVAFSGRGPIKESTRERAYAYGGSAIHLDLPVLRWEPSAARGARVRVDGGVSSSAEDSRAGDDEVFELDLVEDLSRVANANHERQMPIIYARTFARVAAKAVGVGAATWGASTANNDAFTAAVLIGGIALLLASEEADTRCWTMLPGQAHVRLIEVPAGRHEATVEWTPGTPGPGTSTSGTLYASGRRIVDVPEGGLATMVEYWWR